MKRNREVVDSFSVVGLIFPRQRYPGTAHKYFPHIQPFPVDERRLVSIDRPVYSGHFDTNCHPSAASSLIRELVHLWSL
jgi:hypothetical protein